MQDLHLIGVAPDGEHVLLADEGGARYRVALDEPLRAATRRDRPRLGQLQIEIDGGMRPREVQALIRSGLSADEAAQRSGWSIEKVHRFEGPVLAEREFVAGRARAVVVGGPAPKHAGAGEEEDTLASRAHARLKERGVLPEQVTWDAAKLDDGRWSVTAAFPAGGKERRATWRFNLQLGSLVPHDDEARWLSANTDAALPAPHVAGGAAGEVFDVAAGAGRIRQQRSDHNEPIDLMAAMRDQGSRSRVRSAARRAHEAEKSPQPSLLPVEDAPEDALPVQELADDLGAAPEPPAARAAHPTRSHLDDRADLPDDDAASEDTEDAPSPQEGSSDESATPARARGSRKSRSGGRPGRASVPSWDDIMFGGRGSKS